MSAPTVRAMAAVDWPDVARIYAEGIATGHATFTSSVPAWDEWDAGHLAGGRHVAMEDDGNILGWVAASPVSGRCVYAGVIEDSIYVANEARGRGVGHRLLEALLASAWAGGAWTVQAGVFPENGASVALHVASGFRVVGTRERLGRMSHGPLAGQWRDVLLLECRLKDPINQSE